MSKYKRFSAASLALSTHQTRQHNPRGASPPRHHAATTRDIESKFDPYKRVQVQSYAGSHVNAGESGVGYSQAHAAGGSYYHAPEPEYYGRGQRYSHDTDSAYIEPLAEPNFRIEATDLGGYRILFLTEIENLLAQQRRDLADFRRQAVALQDVVCPSSSRISYAILLHTTKTPQDYAYPDLKF